MSREVLHLIGSNLVGGPEKQILHHAADLLDSEYRLTIGSFHDLETWPEVLTAAEERGLGTFCLPGGLRANLVPCLVRELRRRPNALLCTHGFKANVVGYLATRWTGHAHTAFMRGFTGENRRVRFYEVLERQALRRAQRVVCVSSKQVDEIAPLRRSGRRPIVVKNAMLPPYSRPQEGAAVSRAALGIPDNAFVFGSVGRLSIEKGHRFLLTAFRELRDLPSIERPLFLIVVGNGAEQPGLEQQAEQLGIRDAIYFAGYQGNCTPWMQLMDCMVQPSLKEATPNTVLEALYLNVPVLATAVGGVPDLIRNEQNGLLVPAGDPSAMARAMARLASDPALCRKLTEGGSELTREYSPQQQRQRLLALYDEVFAEQTNRPRRRAARLTGLAEVNHPDPQS
jgi:glycosyltransferase involved in cell wall biosynthesis